MRGQQRGLAGCYIPLQTVVIDFNIIGSPKQNHGLQMSPVLVWFRRNLRVADNAALAAAVELQRPVVPVYVLTEEDKGGASRWWLHHSLASLDRELQQRGSNLVVRTGAARDVIEDVARETGADAVFFSRRYEPASRAEEAAVEAGFGADFEIHAFDDSLLKHPHAVMTQSGTPFRVIAGFIGLIFVIGGVFAVGFIGLQLKALRKDSIHERGSPKS